ncbi:MAG TPA: FAD-dependent oxidoreductase [Tepidisphaeraceae bacterium]|nr:FAD-dependent oxidoreductase [Tepidisphaeraceae bacterium]
MKSLIDCTGGGAILKLAGADSFHPPDPPDQRMLHGYAARLAGITGDAELLRLQIPYELAHAVEENALPQVARFTVFHPGPTAGEGICKLAIAPGECPDAQAEVFLNRVIERLTRSIPAMSNAKVVEKSPRILPRDGLRLRGQSVLTETDVIQGRQHSGEAVHAWWPMEKWDVQAGPSYAWPPAGRHYDITAAMLQSEAIENLFAAGACLSATASAAASSRASGICLATGDLAGRMATEALERRC